MTHAYVSNIMHCTFSTKDRYPSIDSELETRLWPYIGGIATKNQMTPLAIRGAEDHLHALYRCHQYEFCLCGSAPQGWIIKMDPRLVSKI
jgi:hypothetical protein